MIPRATYRLQLNSDFTFADAARAVPYLAQLGISHLYASPILMARPGSRHGYDVIDPTRVNPELGGEVGLRSLVAELRRNNLGLVVDMVPNHMYAGAANEWWFDVLRHGRVSSFAKFFDIDWDALGGKIILPILDKPFGDALADGDIVAEGNVIRYFEHVLPIAPGSVPTPSLAELLNRQHYRLAWWRTAADTINWRRFFDINDLVAVRVEDPEVFEATHATLLRLFADGLIDGFRVDHVDGLADPGGYCRTLRARLTELRSEPAYLIVEKIVGRDEKLPEGWGTDGTVGYDFMNEVSAVLHDPAGAAPLTQLWSDIADGPSTFEIEEEAARREILSRSFAAPLEALIGGLVEVARRDLGTRDFTAPALRRCVVGLLSQLRVYRTYPDRTDNNAELYDRAVEQALKCGFRGDRETLAWLRARLRPPAIDGVWRNLQTKFQQLSASVAAKAVEDTAFYRYGRLLSRNDVGFDAARFALSPTAFHAAMNARRAAYPHAMLATATHDHKRGEDVRARLSALSQIPDEWTATVMRCFAVNTGFRDTVDGAPAPNRCDEAMLYQTIVGAWPMDLLIEDHVGRRVFAERLTQWQRKAMREEKRATDWIAPNIAYEEASARFLQRLVEEPADGLRLLVDMARRIDAPGMINSLAQTVLKLMVPGVPDLYQGTEFWDLSLVDPDNRRPVDFQRRKQALDRLPAATKVIAAWRDGRQKQGAIARLLELRRLAPDLFAFGDYMPIHAVGAAGDCVIAFGRRHGTSSLYVFVTVLASRLLKPQDTHLPGEERWQGTKLLLSGFAVETIFRDVLTDRTVCLKAETPASDIFADFPAAVLIGD